MTLGLLKFFGPLHTQRFLHSKFHGKRSTSHFYKLIFVPLSYAASTALASSKPAPSLRPRREVVPEANMALGVLVLVVVGG